MGRYIKTKADFTLRTKHKKGSGMTIYETDYTTINPMPNALKGEYVIGDSNFVFTTRLGANAQKKHARGKVVPNPMGEESAWTIETIIDSGITEETKVWLKPNYTSIRDFACYGSAVKLVQGTVNGVIEDFPAEMWLSEEILKIYDAEAGYAFIEENAGDTPTEETLLYNEYGIDIITKNISEKSIYNPLRYFALCGSSYTYIDASGEEHDFIGFDVSATTSGTCYEGKNIWVDKLAKVTLSFCGATVNVNVYRDNRDENVYYTWSGGEANAHIRPKKEYVENFFNTCDDFTAVLLDRQPNPIYTATFETPAENETGFSYEMQTYTWPTLNGGFNPDLSGPYYSYLNSLIHLGEFYDEYYSDNMWRSLTHEAIKTLDWTYVSNTDGDIEDLSTIDTSRIEPITKIYGRQFDDLKRYADTIKNSQKVTYDQKANAPDYSLTDILANSGWETRTLKITTDDSIMTEPLYSGLSYGYNASDANTEFLRRLKLNSKYLFSAKGTRKGIDALLAMFGLEPDEYTVNEYVYVFSGGEFPHFCNETEGKSFAYPLAKDVSIINKYKVNFNVRDPYGDYCGIPVTEIGYTDDNGEDYSYVVPWYSYGKKYDNGLYFQMNGGWGKREVMDVDLAIAPEITELYGDQVPLYSETQARLRFAKDFDDMLQGAFLSANTNDVFYVTDISDIETRYTVNDDDLSQASHYFILENAELNQFLGYNEDYEGGEKYGWRSVGTNEIADPEFYQAGAQVIYLESIKDDTTGNNPHIGNGLYDGGLAYISGMSEVFAYSLINKNFIGINDETCEKIAQYKFPAKMQVDNRKCWYFTDNYNEKDGINSGETLTFKEADITEDKCPKLSGYEITEILESDNAILPIGDEADPHMYSGEMYTRTTDIKPFDPEIGTESTSGEAAANSIVNVKNIDLSFAIPSVDYETEYRKYIEGTVIPYLAQMIPSTSIMSWKFTSGRTRPVTTYKLVVEPKNASISETGTTTLTAYKVMMVDGVESRRENISSKATWTITSGGNYATVNGGVITGKNKEESNQTISISVSYDGYSDTASVSVGAHEPVYTYSMKVIPDSTTIDAQGSTQLRARFTTIKDGVEQGTEEVNATWAITAGGSYATISSGGKLTGTNTTTTSQSVTVQATYNGQTATTTITVDAALSYSMKITADRTSIEPQGTTQVRAYLVTSKNGVIQSTVEITPTWSITEGISYALVSADGKVTGTNTGATAQNVTISASYTAPSGELLTQTTGIRVQGEAYIIPNLSVISAITSGAGSTGEIEIFTNLDWPITITVGDPENFEVIGTPVKPQSTVIVRAKTANLDPEHERRVIITFSDPRGLAEDATVLVIQYEGAVPLVSPTVTMSAEGNIPVPKEGGTATVTITVTDGTFDHYEVTPGVTVVSVQQPNETTAIITLSFGANTTGEEVVCTVTGYGRGVGYSTGLTSSETIEVPQTYSKWSLSDVDYVIFTYGWGSSDGKDLDSFTFIDGLANSSNDTYGNYFQKGVGFGNGAELDREKYIAPSLSTSVLRMGSDNIFAGGEYTLVNFKQLNEDIVDAISKGEIAPNSKLIIYLMGNWYGKKSAGNASISFEAYKGGEPVRVKVTETDSHKYIITGDTTLKGTHTEPEINVFAGGVKNFGDALDKYSSMAAFVYDYKYASFNLVTGEHLESLSGSRYRYGRYYTLEGTTHITGSHVEDKSEYAEITKYLTITGVDFTKERTYTINLDCNINWGTGSTPGSITTVPIRIVENSCTTDDPSSSDYDGDIILTYVNPTTFSVTFPAGHRYSGSSSTGYCVYYNIDATNEYVANYFGSQTGFNRPCLYIKERE